MLSKKVVSKRALHKFVSDIANDGDNSLPRNISRVCQEDSDDESDFNVPTSNPGK